MGKPKNKGKPRDAEEDSDTEAMDKQNDDEVPAEKPTGKQSKKDKRKKKGDDWEDDVASELASLSLEANKGLKETNSVEEEEIPAPKKEKKKKKKQKDDEDEDDGIAVERSNKKMAAFNMLMMDDDDNDVKSESDKEEEEVKETSKQPKKKDKKKKDKKEKAKTTEEEDLDALLAEIDKPKEKSGKKKKGKKNETEDKEETNDKAAEEEAVAEVEKQEPKVVTMEDLEDEEDDRKKKRKKKGREKEVKEEGGDEVGEEKAEDGGDGEGEEAEGATVKTAAQKRKEKKEREKKKLADKKKQAAMKKDGTKTEGEKEGEAEGKTEAATGKDADAEKKASDDEGEEEGKKKKKKKKGEKEKEKEEKVKKPSARVKLMQEMLKKQKEEEERLKQEEEERIRKEEEAYAAAVAKKEEEERRKAEKKERQRLKREQLKAEGLLLTPAQKQERKRAQQMLEMMKAQGIELPDKEEIKKKRPVYEHKKKKQQKKEGTPTAEESPSPTETTPATTPLPEGPAEVEKKVEEEGETVEAAEPEATTATPEEEGEGVKDEWDASSEEEEEEKESSPDAETKIKIVDRESSAEAKAEEEDEEESDDESDEDESGEDEDDDATESESESESDVDDDLTSRQRAQLIIRKRHERCEAKRTTDKLRAPVVCVLGHVDTGKTKILDKLRRTNVQDGEAGGITQQIGATNVPAQAILDKTTMCKDFQKKEMKLPGLLIIDTPGHESFSNLRSRGSSLCDIAILVIDVMHGLEPQTIESINLLKERKTPFVVALNKIDRLYQWKTNPNSDVMNTIKKQTQMCKQEFDERKNMVIAQLAEQSLNAALFYENKNPKEYVSLIPTSAHTGDGMGNLLSLICELCQTWLAKKISYTEELQATVMEVKALPGLGTTVDVILVNGKLAEGDQIVLAGTEGPIVTQIRGCLMPQPMRELRVKAQYEHHKEVMAAQGVKIIGKDLEKALAGLPLYVATDEDEVDFYKEELSEALKDVLNSIKLSERGVFVQASTLGSLEALLEFLRTSKIPYAGINIGPVHKRDIMKASIMLEHDAQWAVILAFDVKVEREAQEMADSLGVHIFTADIIYHLQDAFLKFRDDLKKQKKEEFGHVAVFPCKLRVLPQHIFNKRDPIVMGVVVEAGIVRLGTPICVPSKENVELGRITSIEVNHKPMEKAGKGVEVCIKIENIPGETPKLFGRHFDHTDMLVSKISRNSIDAVKDYFRDEMTKQEWTLMVELKKQFQIL